jgi:phosphopantetheinyl transferase (holo-ACP synthase)
MGWRDIGVREKPTGEPFLVFSGSVQELAATRRVTSAVITLSHTEHHANRLRRTRGLSASL